MVATRAVVLVAVSLLFSVSRAGSGQPIPRMTAHFIDVGQAHSTLLEFPCGAMLVDVGSQDQTHSDALVAYLEAFFARRADLSRTLEAILISHNHVDHTRALRPVVEGFTVRRFIDNGFATGSGASQTNWLKTQVESGALNVQVLAVADADVVAVTPPTGLTNAIIDPINCTDVDPLVRVLQGRLDENPGWTDGSFENQNNHSLVTRVDFGEASFLFIGDLEEDGIELLGDYYSGGRVLDADVLQVGHHGSHNATTESLMTAVTPSIAVIPVGRWTFGQGSAAGFSTFAFGHPRATAVNLLARVITRRRNPAKSVMVADRARRFHAATITRAIYATGWDGTVRVVADTAGQFTVFREQ